MWLHNYSDNILSTHQRNPVLSSKWIHHGTDLIT